MPLPAGPWYAWMAGDQGIYTSEWLEAQTAAGLPGFKSQSHQLVSCLFSLCLHFPHLQMGIIILPHRLIKRIQRVAICKAPGIVTAAGQADVLVN